MITLNEEANGYCGIWYGCQRVDSPYVYKYSGGLGTYSAKHSPFAVYAAEANKTFFCFGGASREYHTRDIPDDSEPIPDALLHMVACYDHDLGVVSRPTVLLDKQTPDAHDNPVISLDEKGHIWIFSTAHGTMRPTFIHRSTKPYDIDSFELIDATRQSRSSSVPFDNFSYFQIRHRVQHGFAAFLTRYDEPARRTAGYITSPDGRLWSRWQPVAAIEEGHYQVGEVTADRAGTALNYHPAGNGLNGRTNLYYMETRDNGRTWQNVHGKALDAPLTKPHNPALVQDYQSDDLLLYLKDIVFDEAGHPVILYLTAPGFEPGPENDPRTWHTARWTGDEWEIRPVTTSDSNYDMGSLYVDDGTWRIVAPTEPGPQPYNPGGEMVMWKSDNQGDTWTRAAQLTVDSPRNHTYARRPVNCHPDFYAFWADGDTREPSQSRLYFCNRAGEVFMMPPEMSSGWERPSPVEHE